MENNQLRSVKRWLAVVFGWIIAFVFLALVLRMFLAVMVAGILLVALAAWAVWPDFYAAWVASRKSQSGATTSPKAQRRS